MQINFYDSVKAEVMDIVGGIVGEVNKEFKKTKPFDQVKVSDEEFFKIQQSKEDEVIREFLRSKGV